MGKEEMIAVKANMLDPGVTEIFCILINANILQSQCLSLMAGWKVKGTDFSELFLTNAFQFTIIEK